MSKFTVRVCKFRAEFQKLALDAVIVPNADPHLSEYIDQFYASQAWLSGFTGSSGVLVVSTTDAALITDSRYWEQAEKQIAGSGISLVKAVGSFENYLIDWCKEKLAAGDKIGVCGSFISEKDFETLDNELNFLGIKLVELPTDPVAKIRDDRINLSFKPIYEFVQSPVSRQEKFKLVKKELEKAGASQLLLTSLEDIAWITNLRGSDIPCTPVFYGFALFKKDGKLDLFVNKGSVPKELAQKLASDGIKLHPYGSVVKFLGSAASKQVTIADRSSVNRSIYSALSQTAEISKSGNPITRLKAIKTEAELRLIRKAMKKDGVALVKFFKWLEENVDSGKLDEVTCAEKLLQFRREQAGFISESFNTICAFGPNAALPHYRPLKESARQIKGNNFLLIDSGAQYLEGTTDITRTVLVGRATKQMKSDYTAVLRGHIRLAMARFPDCVAAETLDVIAREPIWANQQDYGHGTGHGVGFFLGVHEGPHRISYPRLTDKTKCIQAQHRMEYGMVTSNEPGIYRPRRWGIRIENLLATVEADTNEFGHFLKFETLTMYPIEIKAVVKSKLMADEIKWLNDYHRMVYRQLAPLLADDPAVLSWLQERTRAI